MNLKTIQAANNEIQNEKLEITFNMMKKYLNFEMKLSIIEW